MKYSIWTITLSFQLILLAQEPQFTNSSAQIEQTKQRLRSYERGDLTLEQVTETPGPETGRRLIDYYESHTNDITPKMRLAIARCYAGFGRYSEASQLVRDYVNVYSNDWRGWDILGGAAAMQGLYEESFIAMTNAVALGSEKNLVTLGAAALATERLSVLREMIVPRLIVLKDAANTSKAKKTEMVQVLLAYSLKADDKDIFLKVLTDRDISTLLREDRVKALVEQGCALFETDDAMELCRKIGKVTNEKKAKP